MSRDSKGLVQTDRPGFVLPATILALVVVGALITGGVFLGGQETQVSMSAEFSTEAFLAAERGLAEAIGGSHTDAYSRVSGDAIYETSATARSGDVETRYTLRFKALGNDLFFVESTGEVLSGNRFAGATHRTGMIVRPVEGGVTVRSAVETVGEVEVGGNGYVSGHDRTPTGWEDRCDEPGGSVPGIVSSGPSETSGNGEVDGADPPIVQDPDIDPSTFLVFGGMTYDQLAARADYTIGSGNNISPEPSYAADGTCDVSDSNNWGESTGPCANHFPVIHVTGDAVLKGTGQGILLVDGDFVARGGGRFTGLVIVLGELKQGGGNGGVTGGVIVFNDGDHNEDYKINGNGIALYSRCAVNTATRYANAFNEIVPIVERNWVDLSGSGAATY